MVKGGCWLLLWDLSRCNWTTSQNSLSECILWGYTCCCNIFVWHFALHLISIKYSLNLGEKQNITHCTWGERAPWTFSLSGSKTRFAEEKNPKVIFKLSLPLIIIIQERTCFTCYFQFQIHIKIACCRWHNLCINLTILINGTEIATLIINVWFSFKYANLLFGRFM